jgi:NAD(P)-dependent dehydrogenase (short-subunit alcohol dehydrogenase family)
MPRMTSLAGRTAIVTGAGRGIGRATALQLARMGAAVVVNDLGTTVDGTGRDASVAETVVAEIEAAGGRAMANATSVTDFAGVERMVADAIARYGAVDIVVNNAGMSWSAPIWETDAEVFDRVSSSHAKGTFNTIRCAAPGMRARGWGRIVNLVSRAGLVGIPGSAAYAAGKGAVFALTNVAARDLASSGVTVNAVNPGSTGTRMVMGAVERAKAQGGAGAARAAKLEAALQPPEDVAALIAALCTEDAGRFTGQVFFVAKNEVGLFRPLAVDQMARVARGATVETLLSALGGLKPNPLDAPY